MWARAEEGEAVAAGSVEANKVVVKVAEEPLAKWETFCHDEAANGFA